MMATYEELRTRHQGDAMPMVLELAARFEWSPDRLAEHRTERLRALVARAKEESPWHAKRLADVDPDALTGADLTALPTMTKDDLMANWDEIVTDQRVTLAGAERHLDGLGSEDAYFLDEFHVCASGGSSGRRGVFVFGWDEWARFFASFARFTLRIPGASPIDGPVMVTVGAISPTHMTFALGSTFSVGASNRFGVDMPLADIVRGLNDLEPNVLIGYPSALGLLVDQQREGHLRISPRAVVAGSEPLLPEVASGIREVWGVEPVNCYGTTEACVTAMGCGHGDMHLTEDLVIVEPVDGSGRPISPGQRSARMFLTSLEGTTLPLIRYEVTDEITLLAESCPCGITFQKIADIQGRHDDVFAYEGGVAVHPHVFRSSLSRCAAVVEYQVHQTETGAEVLARTSGSFDADALADQLRDALRGAGLQCAEVWVREVAAIERTGIGKLKRFVPLG
jgi:phenylacetate-coenzyme A ligase PaaK-like adenylate-forming protein